jgi:hypothetical protein
MMRQASAIKREYSRLTVLSYKLRGVAGGTAGERDSGWCIAANTLRLTTLPDISGRAATPRSSRRWIEDDG